MSRAVVDKQKKEKERREENENENENDDAGAADDEEWWEIDSNGKRTSFGGASGEEILATLMPVVPLTGLMWSL